MTIRVQAEARVDADLQFRELVLQEQVITVTADATQVDVQSPDPGEKVFASKDLLDANPGRPGARSRFPAVLLSAPPLWRQFAVKRKLGRDA
jgi:hypothetical protein